MKIVKEETYLYINLYINFVLKLFQIFFNIEYQ